ncbi:MAG: thioesterase [Paenibacillaceae bacterium ZCTH02-B3]|nr:MAG: thioesterase [Paenibacillaceae bacterium ZCTH02-B3]
MPVWQLHPLRVRYQETDRMGVVFHANYATWFEIGRTEWVRRSGVEYRMLEDRGLLLPLVELHIEFLRPARYDDWVTVCTAAAEWTPLKVRFLSAVMAGDLTERHGHAVEGAEPPGELLARGWTRHVWVGRNWKPVRLDREVPDLYPKLAAWAKGG